MPTKNKNSEKTERIKQRLEQLKATARPTEHEMPDVDAPESNAAPVKSSEFKLDNAVKFTWMVDSEKLEGQYRLNDATITISDPITGYTASMPISLALAIQVTGIGRLVHADSQPIQIPGKFKLRNGEFVASMAIPISLPRVVWRIAQRSIVWAVVQFQPTKNEWRILRLRSTPRQTVYEAQQIMRMLLGDSVYTKLKEAVELLAEPL